MFVNSFENIKKVMSIPITLINEFQKLFKIQFEMHYNTTQGGEIWTQHLLSTSTKKMYQVQTNVSWVKFEIELLSSI